MTASTAAFVATPLLMTTAIPEPERVAIVLSTLPGAAVAAIGAYGLTFGLGDLILRRTGVSGAASYVALGALAPLLLLSVLIAFAGRWNPMVVMFIPAGALGGFLLGRRRSGPTRLLHAGA